jgi:hypothetical protein
MKTYWRSGGVVPHIFNLCTRWRWGVSCTSRPPYPRGKNPRTLWIGGWMCPRAGLNAVAGRESTNACRESSPGRPARNQVIILEPNITSLSYILTRIQEKLHIFSSIWYIKYGPHTVKTILSLCLVTGQLLCFTQAASAIPRIVATAHSQLLCVTLTARQSART